MGAASFSIQTRTSNEKGPLGGRMKYDLKMKPLSQLTPTDPSLTAYTLRKEQIHTNFTYPLLHMVSDLISDIILGQITIPLLNYIVEVELGWQAVRRGQKVIWVLAEQWTMNTEIANIAENNPQLAILR